jgi:ribosomal protein S18 acetylase RimI-like enzyme
VKVTLEIPDDIEYQLVYRRQFTQSLAVETRSDVTFTLFSGAVGAAGSFRLLRRHLGIFGTLKTIVKLATPRRTMYLITKEDRVVSIGWCMSGTCKYYQVESHAIVVGPIWSSDEMRGQGIATYAMRMAINELVRRGHSTFYIDTSKSNFPAQRVFEKIGFGPPVGLFLRLGTNKS